MYAVTLDLWRTLIDEGPGDTAGRPRQAARIDGVLAQLRAAGLTLERNLVERAMAKSRESFDRDHDRGVDVRFRERVSELLRFIDPELPGGLADGIFERIIEAVDAPFLQFPPVPATGARAVLQALRDLGLRLALISNTGFTSAGTYRRWMESLDWLGFFEVTTFSNEIALAKPTPEIFLRTLDTMDISPGHALHAGDSLVHDVAGAQGAGLRAAWIQLSQTDRGDVLPDYTVQTVAELPAAVERWLDANRAH